MTTIPNTRTFTAAEIARAMSVSRQAARAALRSTRATATVVRGGISCPAWSLSDLPATVAERLLGVALKRGYRGVEDLLTDPPKRWEPAIPIAEIADEHIAKAVRVRDALRRAVALSLDPFAPAGAAAARAVEDYRREFGHVSERHVYRVLDRVFERDAGEGRFDDIALYLDEKLSRKPDTTVAPIPRTEEERMILDRADTIRDPQNPARAQVELLWCAICQALDLMIERGIAPKKARRSVVALLLGLAVRLARSEAALRDLVKAKHERWIAGGRCLAAIEDQRSQKSGWRRAPKIEAETLDKIIGHAVVNCGGRTSQAWREVVQAGELPPEIAATYTAQPSGKSYVPTRIRRAIAPEVKRLKAIHHGPREARLQGAHHTRSYDDVAAGDWMQSDDLTPPIYFYTHDERGELSLTRGQYLPMIDIRSAKILGGVLIVSKQYDSVAIRELITKVCLEHGLPRKGFYFENGIWRSSRILTGKKNVLPWDEADRGLRGLGLQIMHAKLPRGKVVENVLGILQNQMERVPGYCGRDERKDKYERVQRTFQLIRAGHEDAADHLLDEQGIVRVFAEIAERYNNEPQEGRLNGLSPNEAWERFQSPEPRPKFDHRTAWILARDVQKVRVGRNGITLRIGKRTFNYKGAATGRYQGEQVIVRFNPAAPEVLPFQPVGSDEVFFAEHCPETPAFGAGETFEHNERQIDAHNSYARRRYHIVKNTLPASCFRINLPDFRTIETARQIDARETAVKAVRERKQVATKAAREVGLAISSDQPISDRRVKALNDLRELLSEESP